MWASVGGGRCSISPPRGLRGHQENAGQLDPSGPAGRGPAVPLSGSEQANAAQSETTPRIPRSSGQRGSILEMRTQDPPSIHCLRTLALVQLAEAAHRLACEVEVGFVGSSCALKCSVHGGAGDRESSANSAVVCPWRHAERRDGLLAEAQLRLL